MPLDGVFLKAVAHELNETLASSRLIKIQEIGGDQLLLSFRTGNGIKKVFLSANPSLPLLKLTEEGEESLPEAPAFCMMLRKHLMNGRLILVTTAGLDRAITFEIEHLNELGDPVRLSLIHEIMGKHSNIMLVDESGTILDAIRHVTPLMSSVRTVLPGKPYFLPDVQHKKDALTETEESFLSGLNPDDTALQAVTRRYAGISELTFSEVLFRHGIDADQKISALSPEKRKVLSGVFLSFLDKVKNNEFSFEAAYRELVPVQFAAVKLDSYRKDPALFTVREFSSPSALLSAFYREKNAENRKKERAADLSRTVKTLLERATKKRDLQTAQLRDTENKEENRLAGELLSAYSYMLPVGVPSVTVENYYDENKPMTISVDPDLSIAENAKKYFDKYARQKRTAGALTVQIEDTNKEIDELLSVSVSLSLAETEADLQEIRDELAANGFLKKSVGKKQMKREKKSLPYHYITSDGFHLYAGKNNLQNDALTFHLACGNDYFFHAKKMPGSHVILKTEGREVPDRAFEEAASLAAYCSSGRENPLVEVDYVLKKEVKKVPGQKPGFVIYDTNYSMMAVPTISSLREYRPDQAGGKHET